MRWLWRGLRLSLGPAATGRPASSSSQVVRRVRLGTAACTGVTSAFLLGVGGVGGTSAAEPAVPGSGPPGAALLAKASEHIAGIDEYTRAQVAEHTTAATGIWVTYGSGVYDITDFVKQHPGGMKRIMLAAGKDLGAFWRIYQQHFGEGAAETVAAHLMRMRIANLVPGEGDVEQLAGDDPFLKEPKARHPSLKVWSQRAFNAEV
jgi:sulfite oxidase